LRSLIHRYTQLPRAIMRLVSAGLMINLVNAGFILILNIYLRKQGYPDDLIASFTSYRFLGVLILAFPLGIFIKGKPLRPYFIISSIIIPVAGLLMLESIKWGNEYVIKISFLMWGIGLMLMQVCTLPFIMRSTPEHLLPEAISLSFSTWSFSIIFTGLLIAVLTAVGSVNGGFISFTWTEYEILLLLIIISTGAIFVVSGIKESPPRTHRSDFKGNFGALLYDYDWSKIFKALIPTLLIAVGAGLTIPFVNLFFNAVFSVDSDQFGLIGSIAAGLGLVGSLLIPAIKRRFGYNIAILLTQSMAIVFLVMLAVTEIYASVTGMLYLAVLFYIMRQPLMHMAAPITSELTMKYVGKKNQELISAINSSIWSASWYISAKLFQFMRSADIPYFRIFFITAALYAVGVLMYFFIIREYEGRNPEKSS